MNPRARRPPSWRTAGSSEKLSRERAILEAAERLGLGALDLLRAAARAEEWWGALPRVMNLDLRKVGQQIADEIKRAPSDVNPLLSLFILRSVETARGGGEPVIGRAALRKALASVVPPGRQGKLPSRIPFQVFYVTASTPADVALLARKGLAVSVPNDPKAWQKRQDENARRLFRLTPGSLRTAKSEGRKAARALPDAPLTR